MYPEPSTAQKLIKDASISSLKRLKTVRKEARDIGINTPGMTTSFVFGEHGGVHINEEKAMCVAAVYACVSYIADYVASLPKITYERTEKGRNRATNHWLYPLVHDDANPYMNDYEFCETLTGHVLLWGNAYAEILRNGTGEVTDLWPLRPDRVRPFLHEGKLFYEIMLPNGGQAILSSSQVFHLHGLGFDGLVGYSPIKFHRDTMALSVSEQEYRSAFFKNDASPGGILMHPNTLSESAQKRLLKQWEERHQGLGNKNRVAIFEEGMTWQAVGAPAKDMEYVEGKKLQKMEIASIFRVRPHKIGILEPGTVSFASIEAQNLDTHVDTMRPWIIRWEKKYSHLLSKTERQKFYVEFLFDALLRADSESRARTLQTWRLNGIINGNEWRALENLNEIPHGDDYWIPANMSVVGQEPDEDILEVPMHTNGNGNGKPADA